MERTCGYKRLTIPGADIALFQIWRLTIKPANQAEEKLNSGQFGKKQTAGAKARLIFQPLTARLKSCPVTRSWHWGGALALATGMHRVPAAGNLQALLRDQRP